jgi:hypothetical protein
MDKEHPLVGWVPNLYSKLPDYVEKAIQKEVAAYNLPTEKAASIVGKIYATLAASYQFDPSFTSSFSGATPSDRERIIREFLREYIRREIDLEAENIKREVHQKITDNYKENYLQVLDPRGKDYKKYRDNIVGILFPETKVVSDSFNKSDFKASLDSISTDFNAGKITQAQAESRISAIEASIDAHLDDVHFNTDSLQFLDRNEALISSRIDTGIKSGIYRVSSSKDIANLHAAVLSGDITTFKKYVVRKEQGNSSKILADLTSSSSEVKIDTSGNMSVTGDGFKSRFFSGMESSGKKLDGSPYKYIRGVQLAHLQANISDLAVLATTSPTAKTSKGTTVSQLLEKNKLANDILNVSNAVRHIGKLDSRALSKLNVIKSQVENSINSGVMDFGSDAEKQAFLNALKSNDARYLDGFVKPGLLGTSSFSRFIKDVNDENVDLGGATNSVGLTTRGLNFQNSESAFKRNLLNQYIYAAQLGFDPGYAYSEIKQRLKDKMAFTNFKNFDVKAAAKAQMFKAITSISINGKKASEKELESILGFYKDPQTTLKNFFGDGFKGFLKKNGIDISVKSIWESYLYKLIKQQLKLKLEKNLRYLEQLLKLGLKKLSGPIGNSLKKLINRLGGSSAFLKRAFSGVGSFFSWATGSKKGGTTFFEYLKRIVISIVLISVLLYVTQVLGIVINILASFSSNSGTPYMPGSYADLTFSTYQSVTPEVIMKGSPITSSGNVCISSLSNNMFTGSNSNWNNLRISEFEGTDNSNNCKIMCNARKIMGGIMPGADGNLNCNYNYPNMYKTSIVTKVTDSGGTITQEVATSQFWCTHLIMKSLVDDDPTIDVSSNAAVIGLDKYMKDKPTLYERNDLAIPNSSTATPSEISAYRGLCVPRANFQPGNPVIFRINTCNDSPDGGAYNTSLGGVIQKSQSGHVEMILKLEGDTLTTISTNNVIKKVRYQVSSQGCDAGKVKVISYSGTTINKIKYPMYLCRMYQYKNPTGNYTCPSRCDIPANTYGSVR